MSPAKARWFMRLHPAIIAFSYTAFVFFGGFWNWVFHGYVNTFIAASISAGAMLIPSLLCLAIRRRTRLGVVGIYLGAVVSAIITCVYTWRAYVALFEQSNTPKAIMISIQVCLGIVACVLLLANRGFAQATGQTTEITA